MREIELNEGRRETDLCRTARIDPHDSQIALTSLQAADDFDRCAISDELDWNAEPRRKCAGNLETHDMRPHALQLTADGIFGVLRQKQSNSQLPRLYKGFHPRVR